MVYFNDLSTEPFFTLRLINGTDEYNTNYTDYVLDENFIKAVVERAKTSPLTLFKYTCKEYREGHNKVVNTPRTVLSRSNGTPALSISPVLADNRIANNFFNQLVEQKSSLLLARDYSIIIENQAVQEAYNDNRINIDKALMKLAEDAIVYGTSYGYCYYQDGTFKVDALNPLEVIPIWEDKISKKLAGLIRVYKVNKFINNVFKDYKEIEVYTKERIDRYHYTDNDTLEYFESEKFTIEFPVFSISYNNGESLLKNLKPLIDNYDRTLSTLANTIQDAPNSIKVIKGYSGADKDAFIKNLAEYRTAFIDEDGGLESLETPLAVVETNEHLKTLKQNIFQLGKGVDIEADSLGNASGAAIRYRYSALTADVEKFSKEMQEAVKVIVGILADFHSTYTGEVEVVFNMDNSLLESAVIEDIKNSVGIISNRTLLEQHPWVKDVDDELSRINAEATPSI